MAHLEAKAWMQILATGRSDYKGLTKLSDGFTLVEVLVAILIVSIMVAGISLTLPDNRHRQEETLVEAMQTQANRAIQTSFWSGRAHAWEILPSGSRVLIRQDDIWQPATDPWSKFKALPEGMRISSLEVNGESKSLGTRIIFQRGALPDFKLVIEAPNGQWHFFSRPDNQVHWRKVQPGQQ